MTVGSLSTLGATEHSRNSDLIFGRHCLFIVGAPRSGTTWLQMMIAAHPNVCSTVEQTIFRQYIAPWVEAYEREAAWMKREGYGHGLPFLWDEPDFCGFIREFIERVYARILATNPEATHILDKHPDNCHHVDLIDRMVPGARFIHIIRDGRDVATSIMAASREMNFGPPNIHGAATVWKACLQGARQASKFKGRYLEVRYEDLKASCFDVMKPVFEFCGLPTTDEQVAGIVRECEFQKLKERRASAAGDNEAPEAHYRKGKVGSWQEELSQYESYLFEKLAGALLRELGYAGPYWWARSRLEQSTLPTRFMFRTVFRTFRSLPRCVYRHVRDGIKRPNP
ncbi:MAG: sulfotransferase [Phycisphaerae bacterium]